MTLLVQSRLYPEALYFALRDVRNPAEPGDGYIVEDDHTLHNAFWGDWTRQDSSSEE